MKFPLFFRKKTVLAPRDDPKAELEKLLVESFRVLGRLFSKVADSLEHTRLEREGYGRQERFLERVNEKK